MRSEGEGPFQASWFYAIPAGMASVLVCSLIYGLLPRLGGARDIIMVISPVLITIYTINEIERAKARR